MSASTMSYCLEPTCSAPMDNEGNAIICNSCGATLVLRERYRALHLLGQGGFGRTILAVDESQPDKPRCVIKQFFPQQQARREKASYLFRQEAERLKSLQSHPQIPDLLDYFEEDGQQYLVQEFIDGTDLTASLEQGNLYEPQAVIQLLERLLPVLEFMHGQNIIHRDIKPANIIRRDRDQQLFLVDMGAAKVATGTALARTGTTIGSAEYTAPEQLRGKAVFASDIYSLGMTCLHLLTGVSPFNLYDADEGRLAWQDYLKAPLNPKLSKILAGMTEVATKQRYGSAKEVLQDLQRISTMKTATHREPPHIPPAVPRESITGNVTTTNHPVVKSKPQHQPGTTPTSRPQPVTLELGQQRAPLSIELNERARTTLATPLSKTEPRFPTKSNTTPSTSDFWLSILSGELPISSVAAWIQREAPDFKGDLAWVCGRTALTLLLVIGVPTLLIIGMQSIPSQQQPIHKNTIR